VQDARFSISTDQLGGIPGKSYTVDIMMTPLGDAQPPEVQAVIGKDGENLRGPLLSALNAKRRSNEPAVIPVVPFSNPTLGYLIPLPDHFECATASSPLSKHRSPGSDSIQTDLGSV
jgi:hypothetical protein